MSEWQPDLDKEDGKLQEVLDDGGSVFTVRPDRNSLQRRVCEATALAMGRATTAPDIASEELSNVR